MTRGSLASGGGYICSASNGVGLPAHATIHLTVLCRSHTGPPSPPKTHSYIAVQPRLLRSGLTRPEEEPGQTVLECEVSGQPRPGLVWTRGLNTINISQRFNIHALEVGGQVWRHSLNILQLREEDYGNYSCLATNKVGSAR